MAEHDILAALDFEVDLTQLSPAEIGQVMLMEVGLDTAPLDDLERQRATSLHEIQSRHMQELEDASVLWRAVLLATEPDIDDPHKRLMPSDVPYRACAYRQALDDQEVRGVRLIATDFDAEGLPVESWFDIPVHRNGKPVRPFGHFHVEIVDTLLEELTTRQQELALSDDLASLSRHE